jgi:hypothetical protein
MVIGLMCIGFALSIIDSGLVMHYNGYHPKDPRWWIPGRGFYLLILAIIS